MGSRTTVQIITTWAITTTTDQIDQTLTWLRILRPANKNTNINRCLALFSRLCVSRVKINEVNKWQKSQKKVARYCFDRTLDFFSKKLVLLLGRRKRRQSCKNKISPKNFQVIKSPISMIWTKKKRRNSILKNEQDRRSIMICGWRRPQQNSERSFARRPLSRQRHSTSKLISVKLVFNQECKTKE